MKPWLQLLRISNLPTVWANTLAGFVMGHWVLATNLTAGEQLQQSWPLMLGFSLIYVGGMAMNDVLDAPRDQVEKPGRPIPAGRITRRAAAIATAVLLAAGLACLEGFRQAVSESHSLAPIVGGMLLVALVVTYNLVHHRSSLSVVLLALCRGLVILTSATAVDGSVGRPGAWRIWLLAAAVAGYVLALSVVARGEDRVPGPRRRQIVMVMLATIPLVDALFLIAIGQWLAALFCIGCMAASGAAQRIVSGT